ncbi:MAG: hypothetical protein R2771_09525 [Saprospiraceae bacterium]
MKDKFSKISTQDTVAQLSDQRSISEEALALLALGISKAKAGAGIEYIP